MQLTESRLLKARYQILVTMAISTAILVVAMYLVFFEHVQEDLTSYVVLTALALSIATVQLMRYYGAKRTKDTLSS